MSILDDIAGIVNDAVESADIPRDITLTRMIPGSGPDYDPGTPTKRDYPCRGFVDTFRAGLVDGQFILAGDVKIAIFASSLEVSPVTGDKLLAKGTSYTAIDVKTDPAEAVWEIQARP